MRGNKNERVGGGRRERVGGGRREGEGRVRGKERVTEREKREIRMSKTSILNSSQKDYLLTH